jgi:hypothetical protein
MEYKLIGSISIGILLQLVLVQQILAIELFKYVNEDGVTVLDSRIPARYVRSGYTVLSSDGKVLEVVDRALTDEEFVERDRLAALEANRQQALREREAADATLMQLYGNAEDVTRARDIKLATMTGFIKSTRTNLQRMVARKQQLEAFAAGVERSGGTVSQDTIDSIQSAIEQIEQKKQKIVEKQKEIDVVKLNFARDLIRINELYGESPSTNSGR